MLFHKRPQLNVGFQLCPSQPRCFVALFSDRGRVVGGLPDVVTIMEEKVSPACTMAYMAPFFSVLLRLFMAGGGKGRKLSGSIPSKYTSCHRVTLLGQNITKQEKLNVFILQR